MSEKSDHLVIAIDKGKTKGVVTLWLCDAERLRDERDSLRQQLAAAKTDRDAVYALGPHPVEQCQNIPLPDFVSTRFIQVWQYNEKCDEIVLLKEQLAAAREVAENLFRAFHAERTGRISGNQLSNEEMQDIRDSVDDMWREWDYQKAKIGGSDAK